MRPRASVIGAVLLATLAVGGCEGRIAEGGDCPAGVRQATPSGFCVPRWLSLKRGEVFGRKGPGKDYPPVFVYRAKGLPVQVVDETSDWRKICDPDGGEAWVSSEMVDGRRTAMNAGQAPLALLRAPNEAAGAAAYLRPRALAQLKGCRAAWCELSAAGASGWVRQSEAWGLAAAAQCR